ncbi:membrane protein [Vibrio galatheae]|uniref:Membrane protein n=1 Tax=Vibrio galatheae TaxID=579748 RepID=A0A0F4NLJ4_9VIBR|nr:hypothetical protein [Vibrio galatheae]KJY82916.1 membrane protein [Vibrio galatheae]
MKWMLGVLVTLWTCLAIAETPQQAQESAFIHVNMSLELDGIENALQDTRHSLDQIGGALDRIAQSDNLTPQQQSLLGDTIDNLNQLVHLSKDSLNSLPNAFEQSKQAISTQSQLFLDDLRLKVLITIGAIGLVVVLIIAAIAWFILRPMQSSLVSVTQNISSMARAIKVTAQALDSISSQQHEIAQRLEATSNRNQHQVEQSKE